MTNNNKFGRTLLLILKRELKTYIKIEIKNIVKVPVCHQKTAGVFVKRNKNERKIKIDPKNKIKLIL